ncbi:pre-mRNA-splicing factor cwc22 [Striga asiatica]|uniref:Pre-mRNA-splicing factor cwc22 n=1 Tax=Striga asiatica TaxID=4170 RepID=A0A5A7QWS7_STRAF|nr:pre-mRNA-splicing factor cwc22 [Striga asiatica]
MNSPITSSDFTMGVPRKHFEYQRLHWLSTTSKIIDLVRKLDSDNIRRVAEEIMSHDVVWCRGPFCEAVMLAQSVSPDLSTLYAALVAAVNSRFPDVGLLLVKRVVLQLRTTYNSRNRKKMLVASRFLAQLVNQAVAYEVLALDVLQLLLIGPPSHTTVYVAVRFCVECGSLLMDRAPCRLRLILMEFRLILRKGLLSRRAQVSIKRLLGAAKGNRFRKYSEGLDFVEDGERVTHEVSLLHDIRAESSLDSFQSGPGIR